MEINQFIDEGYEIIEKVLEVQKYLLVSTRYYASVEDYLYYNDEAIDLGSEPYEESNVSLYDVSKNGTTIKENLTENQMIGFIESL